MAERLLDVLHVLETKVRAQLFCSAVRHSQWWGSTRDVTTFAKVTHRRGELELAKLVLEGYLVRHEKGARNQERLVRFEAGPAAIKLIAPPRSKRSDRCDRNDRTAAIETIGPPRSNRSQHT
jgi:hypothetical protein